jgi:hypothetical protein
LLPCFVGRILNKPEGSDEEGADAFSQEAYMIRALAKVVMTLAETYQLAFVLLFGGGVVLLATAATGGWPQIGVGPIDLPWRYVLAVCGITALAVAIATVVVAMIAPSRQSINPRIAGVSIEQPAHQAEVRVPVAITGPCQKVPPGYKLWLFNIGGQGRTLKYYPQDEILVHNARWTTELRATSFSPGDKRRFAVFLVGENGQALVHHFRAAGEAINNVAPPGSRSWPPLTVLTSDVVQCTDTREVTLVGRK